MCHVDDDVDAMKTTHEDATMMWRWCDVDAIVDVKLKWSWSDVDNMLHCDVDSDVDIDMMSDVMSRCEILMWCWSSMLIVMLMWCWCDVAENVDRYHQCDDSRASNEWIDNDDDDDHPRPSCISCALYIIFVQQCVSGSK